MKRAGNDRVKTFTMPVSGSVVLYGPEIDVVQSKAFQRLAGIKQLGTSYVSFRGALHTRFEHSIGALHEAEKMLRAIATNPRPESAEIAPPAWRLARLGALLHDLPHVPFGHTLEDEFHLLKRHDINFDRMQALMGAEIEPTLRAALGAAEYRELVRVLRAKSDDDFGKLRFPFVGDIVGNTVCADLLDYTKRDLAACGMPAALGDRFLDYLTITRASETKEHRHRVALNLDKRGMPRPDVESEVVKLLNYRYELAERVYFHHAKNAASVMIGRAVQEAGFAVGSESSDTHDENFYWLSDELLLRCLASEAMEAAVGIVVTRTGDRQLAADLSSAVLERRLFKIAYIGVHDDLSVGIDRIAKEYGDPDGRLGLENHLASLTGLEPGMVLVHVPRRKMMSKTADVRVRTSSGEIVTLGTWDAFHSRRIAALNEAHERLWRVTVYVHPDADDAARRLVRSAAQDTFNARSRYLSEPNLTAHLREVFELHRTKRKWTSEDLRDLEENPPLAAMSPAAGTLEGAVAILGERIREVRRNGRSPGA